MPLIKLFAMLLQERGREGGGDKDMLENGGEIHPLAWLFIETNHRPMIICKMHNENGKRNSVIMDEA